MTHTGRLVLVFDDGYVEDDEQIRPVLDAAGVSACFAVVPAWLGEGGYLDADRLEALAADGHEIAAHGRRHRRLQAFHLDADAAAGDRRLDLAPRTVPGGDHGIEPGDSFEVTDGERSETVVVEAVEKPTVDIAEGLSGSFDATDTVVRATRATVRDEVVGARDALADYGVDPRTFVFPYDAADTRAWRLAAEEYAVVANAAVRSLPNPPGSAPTNLRRWYLETDHLRPVEVGTYLDAVVETGGVGILAGHSAWETVTPERVEAVLAAARERDVEVGPFGAVL